MESKIQELTSLVYNEGVVKGQQEADKIVAQAKQEAEKLLSDANAQATQIRLQAEKQAQALKENTAKELKMYSTQVMGTLKSEIANVITDSIVKENVSSFAGNKEQFFQFVMEIAKSWSLKENVVISGTLAQNLEKYFQAEAKALLDKGIVFDKAGNANTAFSIAPADGSYKVNFGQEEFENFFKSFVRGKLVEILFN